jgi:hypothetical protein
LQTEKTSTDKIQNKNMIKSNKQKKQQNTIQTKFNKKNQKLTNFDTKCSKHQIKIVSYLTNSNEIYKKIKEKYIKKNLDLKAGDKLSCFYTNATSLNKSKLQELTLIAQTELIHIIFITETWFNNYSSTIINGYTLVRKDRDEHAGGVAIYIREDIEILETNNIQLQNDDIEQIWCSIKINNEQILLGCIYRPPQNENKSAQLINNSILTAKKELDKSVYNGMILAGDFNYPNLKWNPDGTVEVSSGVKSIQSKFIDTLNENFIYQHVNFPTFVQTTKEKNTLDLIMTENSERIDNLTSGPNLGSSNQGHLSLRWKYQLQNKKQHEFKSTKYLYKKADYEKIQHQLNKINWINETNQLDTSLYQNRTLS